MKQVYLSLTTGIRTNCHLTKFLVSWVAVAENCVANLFFLFYLCESGATKFPKTDPIWIQIHKTAAQVMIDICIW